MFSDTKELQDVCCTVRSIRAFQAAVPTQKGHITLCCLSMRLSTDTAAAESTLHPVCSSDDGPVVSPERRCAGSWLLAGRQALLLCRRHVCHPRPANTAQGELLRSSTVTSVWHEPSAPSCLQQFLQPGNTLCAASLKKLDSVAADGGQRVLSVPLSDAR